MYGGEEAAAVDDDGTAGTIHTTRRVTVAGVQAIRRIVVDTAHRVGMDAARVQRFIVAVNEVVINAIQHGGGAAEVTVTGSRDASGDGLVVTVLDHGPGWSSDVPAELPPPDAVHGRGLWLAHRLCRDITIRTSANGTLVRLREPIAD
jgi:anti-sigma regulatory factor (Ser/Thr protein kinase)